LRAAGPSGSDRVRRGGSFDNDADDLRAANRNNDDPSDQNDDIGFRCSSSRACPRLVSKDASPEREVRDQRPRP
jgi:hypothetical protein